MLLLLDYFLAVFHGGLTLFNLIGWAPPKLRRIHLAIITLTIASWFLLGIFYGWGYCPFTDWHWQVKRELGETGLPNSYIKYYLDLLTGLDSDAELVKYGTAILGIGAFFLSVGLNLRDWKNRRLAQRT